LITEGCRGRFDYGQEWLKKMVEEDEGSIMEMSG